MNSDEQLIIVDSKMTFINPSRLTKKLVQIDLSRTKIMSLPTSGELPEVITLKVPNGCAVNFSHFPKLKMFNGEVFYPDF